MDVINCDLLNCFVMRERRDLSGIYFRYKNPDTNKWENWVFEDLPESKQDEVMEGREIEWVKNLAKQLATTLNAIGEQFNITANLTPEIND